MDPRDYCKNSMGNLRTSLGALRSGPHDPKDPNSAWNDVRLNAQSLAADFLSALTLEGYVDGDLRRAIACLLQEAVDIMPNDVNAEVVELLQSEIAEVLLARTDEAA
jgi:hypothetical protein